MHIQKNILGISTIFLFVSVLFWNKCFASHDGIDGLICSPFSSINFAGIVFIWSSALFILTFVLAFMSKKVAYCWSKFSKFYIPTALIVIILSPSIDSSIFGFDKKFMSWFLASIFLLISLIIITRKWWKERNVDKENGGHNL